MSRLAVWSTCLAIVLGCSFTVAGEPGSDAAVEQSKIEFLLKAVAESKLSFLRNGTRYDSAKTADYLRENWKAAGGKIQTAR